MNRRDVITSMLGAVIVSAIKPGYAQKPDPQSDPWSSQELIEPSALNDLLTTNSAPVILCVAFPSLYKQKHIVKARFVGPTSKPDGLAAFRKLAATLDPAAPVLIYCGCCPMTDCPNIRPAYQSLKEMHFQSVRVLTLATNFHTDWVLKNYPVESAS